MFTVGGGRTGKRRVERKVRRHWGQSPWAPPHRPRELRGPGSGKGHRPTAPRPAGHPRSERTSSVSAVPSTNPFCSNEGRKASHAPPPLDGTETPRCRFSKCWKEEKRQKKKKEKNGGGALILACRPHCAKQGAGHSPLPPRPARRSSLRGSAAPRLWSEGENRGRALE